jgi:hypothetical protein
MATKARGEGNGGARPAAKRRVTLVAGVGEAGQVVATGDFSGWSQGGVALKRRKDGAWSATLSLEPGEYQYRLLVDGEWRNNPDAERRVGNGYGSENDVLTVA